MPMAGLSFPKAPSKELKHKLAAYQLPIFTDSAQVQHYSTTATTGISARASASIDPHLYPWEQHPSLFSLFLFHKGDLIKAN